MLVNTICQSSQVEFGHDKVPKVFILCLSIAAGKPQNYTKMDLIKCSWRPVTRDERPQVLSSWLLMMRCDAQTWFAPGFSNPDKYQWDSRLFVEVLSELTLTLLFFPPKMEGIPNKERFIIDFWIKTSIQPPNFQIRKVMTNHKKRNGVYRHK